MDRYPVDLVVISPARYDRVQLALRFAIALALGFVGITVGWVNGLAYFALPVIAAVAISARGAAGYHAGAVRQVWRFLRWLFDLSAYMMLLVDRYPVDEDTTCQTELQPTGTPSVGRALGRLVTSIPAAVVQCIMWCISGIFIVIGWITILVDRTVPPWIQRFQHGVLRGQARLFAYHAALVDRYPPFGLDDAGGAAWPSARAQR